MTRKIHIVLILFYTSLSASETIDIIDVTNTPLPMVIRLISEHNDLNIIPSVKARKTDVSIYLKKLNAVVALEEICSSHNLWLQKDSVKNIYRIYSLDEYKKSVLKFSEEIRIYDLKYPNSKTISKSLFELFPARVIYYESNQDDADDEIQEIENKLEKMLIFEEQSKSSETDLSARGNNNDRNNNRDRNNNNNSNSNSSNNGQGNGSKPLDVKLPEQKIAEKIDLTSAIIHKINTAESIEEIREIINNQDIFKNSRIYISSIANKNQMIIRTSDREALAKIDELIKALDKPNPMVLLEMKILAIKLDDNFESAFDLIYNDGTSSVNLNGGLQTSGALTYSYINDKFNITMKLLEQESKIKTLATPVILTLNNEVSKFFTGNQGVPILTGFESNSQTIINDNTTVTTLPQPVYENRDLGTTLKVSPTINADKTVQLQISSIESELDLNSATVLIPNGDTFNTNLWIPKNAAPLQGPF